MTKTTSTLLVLAALTLLAGCGSSARTPAAAQRSARDPLGAAEIATAFRVVEAAKGFPKGGTFAIVTLREPPKSGGGPREAFAVVLDRPRRRTYEAVVDLRAPRLVSWRLRRGVQPAVLPDEFAEVDAVARTDKRWRQAMRKRGIAPKDVYLDVWAPGDLPVRGARPGDRLFRALSFYRGKLPNPYDRPIEGPVVTVDMTTRKVIGFVDGGVRPVNKTVSGDAAHAGPRLKPLVVTQPQGPSFTIAGRRVTWAGWRFELGYSPREGLILYRISFANRPIVYRLSMDEIYVPYALGDPNWAWRTAFDVGEYNLGQYAEALQRNIDVPANAVFLDDVVGNDTGKGTTPLPHAVAVYERDAGSLWDRADPTTLARDARFGRELVVVAAYVIGNYTYDTEYSFRLDGGMDVRVLATGTTLNEGIRGNGVARDVAAPVHQHFFNFRIDFDVDGTANRVVELNARRGRSGNGFAVAETTLRREGSRDVNPQTARMWKVESTTHRNALGAPTAYDLMPVNTAFPYSARSFPPLQHAAFAQHALWVTRYDRTQLYAAGDYPNQGRAGDGLPSYTRPAQNVDGKDVVLWYTVGLTHMPTTEQFPVMTTDSVEFMLRPDGFFDRNPALAAPK